MKLLFIDTETTGLEPGKHGLVQIAGIIEIDGEEKFRFNLRCRPFPGQMMSPQALAVIGKTKEEIEKFPDPMEAFRDFTEILGRYVDRYDKADKFYMVGQNPAFDYQFLDDWFKRNGNQFLYAYLYYDKIDLIALTAAFKVAGVIQVENVKLGTVAKFYGIELNAHDAMNDIAATREIFYRYVERIKKA